MYSESTKQRYNEVFSKALEKVAELHPVQTEEPSVTTEERNYDETSTQSG